MEFEFKTKPFSHQLSFHNETWDYKFFAVFWEQGTGKTKAAIDKAAKLYVEGLIDAVLIVAPNGVHRNWIEDEIPIHLSDAIAKESHFYFYESSKASTQKQMKIIRMLINGPGLSWLAITYDTLRTKHGREATQAFLEKRKVMMNLDESSDIKNVKAQRTKACVQLGSLAAYKMIMDGTPITQGPFDIYAPMAFLKRDFWMKYHFSSYRVFTHHFGHFLSGFDPDKPWMEFCTNYRYLDELKEILGPYSSRVLKDDVLDIPPKLYQKVYFDPSPEQKRIYGELKEEFMSEVDEGLITAELSIVRLVRFQQVLSGYVPVDGGDPIVTLQGGNPRLDKLVETCDRYPGKKIIWARFTRDIDMIIEALTDKGRRCVRYDGPVSDNDRAAAKKAFQNEPIEDGGPECFVANAAAAGRGLTLHAAKFVVYYNNTHKLRDRLQSEDRAHRAGQVNKVLYLDLMAPKTVDVDIVKSLRKKWDIASQINGDKLKEWL